MAHFADLQVISIIPTQLYRVVINGTNHDYTSDGTPTALEIRDGLITAVNAGAEPVEAFATGADRLLIKADSPTAEHTYSVNSALILLLTVGEESVYQNPSNRIATRIGGATTNNVVSSVKNLTRRERDALGIVYEQ